MQQMKQQAEEAPLEGGGHDADWFRRLAPGSEVWWNDPDDGISSGRYTVASILEDDGVCTESAALVLKNAAGSEAAVFAWELSPVRPDGPH